MILFCFGATHGKNNFLIRIGGVTILRKGKSDLISDGNKGTYLLITLPYLVCSLTFSTFASVTKKYDFSLLSLLILAFLCEHYVGITQ